MRTKEEISILLAEKFKRESARLKSWGTKTDDKAALSFAMAVSEFVRSLMCESRYKELRRFLKHYPEMEGSKYIQERIKATSSMAKAIHNAAIVLEGKRVWKPKVKKHKYYNLVSS